MLTNMQQLAEIRVCNAFKASAMTIWTIAIGVITRTPTIEVMMLEKRKEYWEESTMEVGIYHKRRKPGRFQIHSDEQ